MKKQICIKRSAIVKQLILSLIIAFVFIVKPEIAKANLYSFSGKDTVKQWQLKHNPRLAPVLSAALPGLGQVYNRKVWKVPIIYGGFYALLYSWNYNQERYKKFYYPSVAFPNTLENRSYPFNGRYYTVNELNRSANFYKRYRNLSLIGVFGWYTLNIIDASIDAYTMQFKLLTDIDNIHSPQRAALLSAAIPGLGQIYNKKFAWLKVPVIYGGFTSLYIAWKYNNDYFTIFNDVYKNIPTNAPVDSNYFAGGYGPFLKENIYKEQEYFRRWKDLNLIFIGVLYFLNIIDATVSAYMYNYDINDDLSLRIQPDIIDLNSRFYGSQFPVGLKMTFNF